MSETFELNRKTIVGRKDGPHLLVTGGMRPDEFEPMAAIRRLARLIDPTELFGRVTLVPVVNGPAFERRDGTSEDGLDLAHAFPGKTDGSITQRIAHALGEQIRSADYYIDLRTGGSLLRFMPVVRYLLHTKPALLDEQRRMARAFNLPIIWGTSPWVEGESLSIARDAEVPTIFAGWGGGGACDSQGVAGYVEGCLDVLSELGMLVRSQRERHVEYFLEDPRPASGELDQCNPSPMDGFVEPLVQLGESVGVDEEIADVSDALGNRIVKIFPRQAGVVIALRTFRRVQKGDPLAVILEVDRPIKSGWYP